MSPSIIQVKKLSKSFGDRLVLNGINLVIPEGKITVIMGGSGGGKSARTLFVWHRRR
jgi:ABC-type transporter Mla maintaining outer membrane lipid asymmetry ATPase subunit MlaF